MNQSDLQQPFFAHFLESHKDQEQNNGHEQRVDPWPFPMPTSPLKDPVTDKWPSDGDEV